ncbi:hypothetical protein IID22_00720 [Patescibacteria group bacterium]|nr:hypothetical protein [Patescibacteria group bacterium]
MTDSLEDRPWWDYLEHDLQELLTEATLLLEKVEKWEEKFHDYAFIVFPAAKAYEGFLKKLFLDMGFITLQQYNGKRFRVGKSLNPSLDKHLRAKYSIYDKLVEFCEGDRGLADVLWNTWRECRNLLFHWFPKEKNAIDLDEAQEKVSMIIYALGKAFKECKIEDQNTQKTQRVG